ncbi:uncharacterized protein LOC121375072 [Gigantopelta aegis]|uniref:uncharacterized protein LOC121375072 n=1 Tax=Gigantopelta aegis TaxID=1735272 RepID=UPI001B88C564|nr:uncharacterized protein LOC121375072 [Gigantopelta aegis]
MLRTGMGSRDILFLLILCHVFGDWLVDGRCSDFCPAANETPNVYESAHVYVKGAQFLKLTCCTSDFESITWEKLNVTSHVWSQFPWFMPCLDCSDIPNRETCDAGQAYVVRSTTRWDTGDYRCSIKTAVSVTRRRFSVEYIDCEDLHGQVVAVDRPSPIIKVGEHKNLTLTCRGYFGCQSSASEDRSAEWSYVDADGIERFLHHQSCDRRFHVTHGQSGDGIIKESVLEISGVRTSDYSTIFHCNLVSGSNERESFTVVLRAPDEEVSWNLNIIIIASICVAIFVGFLVAVVTGCYLHYPQIVYHYRRRYDQLPKRDCQLEHDATILCSEENERFVKEEIEPKLKEFQYSVYTEKPNKQEIGPKADAIERSFCTMVIFSQAELDDGAFSFLFNVAATYNGLSIIVIEREPIPRQFWQSAKNQLKRHSHEDETLRHLPKILKTVRWPGTDCKNKRKINNFWAEIKASLPVPHEYKRKRTNSQKSQSSTRPLLSSGAYSSAVVDIKLNDDDDVFVPYGSVGSRVPQNISHDAKRTSSLSRTPPAICFSDDSSTSSQTDTVDRDGSNSADVKYPTISSRGKEINISDGVVEDNANGNHDSQPGRLYPHNKRGTNTQLSADSGYATSLASVGSDVIVPVQSC